MLLYKKLLLTASWHGHLRSRKLYGIKDVLRSFKAIYKEIIEDLNEFLNSAQTATVLRNYEPAQFNFQKLKKGESRDLQALLSKFNDFQGRKILSSNSSTLKDIQVLNEPSGKYSVSCVNLC